MEGYDLFTTVHSMESQAMLSVGCFTTIGLAWPRIILNLHSKALYTFYIVLNYSNVLPYF